MMERPLIRDLSEEERVWEVSVPPENSLTWSITMTYFLEASCSEDIGLLEKLSGKPHEIEAKLRMFGEKPEDFGIESVFRTWKTRFNPFKNKHAVFHNDIQLFNRIFKVRLKEFSRNYVSCTKGHTRQLNVAAEMLNRELIIYYPAHSKFQKLLFSVQSSSLPNGPPIVLFLHESQRGKQFFRFALSFNIAHSLQLKALDFWLQKTNISRAMRKAVQKMAMDPETHGENFLPSIFKNQLLEVISEIYKSHYIAYMLSEACFETNPILTHSYDKFEVHNPSILSYALGVDDPKYIRILLEFAYNCQCLFNGKTVREADDGILNSLLETQRILQTDDQNIDHYNLDKITKERYARRLEYYLKFTDYFIETATELQNIKKRCSQDKVQPRKCIIKMCLETYLKYFYYKKELPNSEKFSQMLQNFLDFYEHYQNIDNFTFSLFFDNFYLLKSSLGMREEHKFLSIEWEIFSYLQAVNYFPVPGYENSSLEKTEIISSNIFNRIPFLLRNTLVDVVKNFITKLNEGKEIVEDQNPDLDDLRSAIIDELLLIRINKYVSAVLQVDINRKTVPSIERALQVIGESIKPLQENGCIASFFLRACLPENNFKMLKDIRNSLSHYRSNSICGRSEIRKKKCTFESIQKELRIIWEWFEVVEIFHKSRIKEALMATCNSILKKENFPVEEIESFENECNRQKLEKQKELRRYKQELEIIKSNLIKRSRFDLLKEPESCKLQFTLNLLRAIEYVAELTDDNEVSSACRNAHGKVKEIGRKGRFLTSKELDERLGSVLEKIMSNFGGNFARSLSMPLSSIPSFLEELKKIKQFTDDEKDEIKTAVEKAYDESKEAYEQIKNEFEKYVYSRRSERHRQNNEKFQDNKEETTEALDEVGLNCFFGNVDCSEETVFPTAKIPLRNIKKKRKSVEEIEALLNKTLLSKSNIEKIKSCFEAKQYTLAVKYLNHPRKELILNNTDSALKDETNESSYTQLIFLKIAFQGTLQQKTYSTVSLSEPLGNKLLAFISRKANFLIERVEDVKKVLIDSSRDIRSIHKFGKSKALKHHNKCLMRQRYMQDAQVRSAVEMGLFDCYNVLNKTDSVDLFKKSKRLFEGIDLRNVLSHCCSVHETVGEVLDETDFPSEIIDKSLGLIQDLPSIRSLVKLFRVSGIPEKESFRSFIESHATNRLVATIKKCERWEKYLCLIAFPN